MNAPITFPPSSSDLDGPPSVHHEKDRLRDSAYWVIAMVAFIAGLAVDQPRENAPNE